MAERAPVAVSVVMPCLNEADTVVACIEAALAGIAAAGVEGEVILADNGSTDGSQALAAGAGARVVPVPRRGYGAALLGGIAAARGEVVIMGDADASYDFRTVPLFLAETAKGADLVMGCRLPAGGGHVRKGAMPFLHRWWGNPMFSFLARHWFRTPVHDVYCGLRAFRRRWQEGLAQQCTGMEFATEMIIKASLHGARIAEVPITLHPDGRTTHPPHLKTFRDGWRTLRFFLLCSPRWLYLVPGALGVLAGLLAYALALPGVRLGGVAFDVHTLLVGSLGLMAGYQALLFGLFTTIYATSVGVLPANTRLARWGVALSLERGLAIGLAACVVGAAGVAATVAQWVGGDFGTLDYPHTMRWLIPSVTSVMLGVQTVLGSFFLGVLGTPRQ